MNRPFLAFLLLVAVCSVDAISGKSPMIPISIELSQGNPLAIAIFFLLAVILLSFAHQCLRRKWTVLAIIAIDLVVLLGFIAVTDATGVIHLALFLIFLVCGVTWLIFYAESTNYRGITILTSALILTALMITVIFEVVNLASPSYGYSGWPVGLIQKGFLLSFCALAFRETAA